MLGDLSGALSSPLVRIGGSARALPGFTSNPDIGAFGRDRRLRSRATEGWRFPAIEQDVLA